MLQTLKKQMTATMTLAGDSLTASKNLFSFVTVKVHNDIWFHRCLTDLDKLTQYKVCNSTGKNEDGQKSQGNDEHVEKAIVSPTNAVANLKPKNV